MMENRKVFGEVRAIEDDSRKVTFVASTMARDRHKTRLNPKGWSLENFNNNPVTGYMHNIYGDICSPPNPDDVLGPARAWVDGDDLMVEIDFETKDLNPLADKIFRKIQNKTLRAVSVGFLELGEGRYGEDEEKRGAENETYYFEGQELLEVSVVNIPSNPEALKKQMRSNTKDALMYLVKAFGDKYSLSEIDEMKVSQIRELLTNRKALGPRVRTEEGEKWYDKVAEEKEDEQYKVEVLKEQEDLMKIKELQEKLNKINNGT